MSSFLCIKHTSTILQSSVILSSSQTNTIRFCNFDMFSSSRLFTFHHKLPIFAQDFMIFNLLICGGGYSFSLGSTLALTIEYGCLITKGVFEVVSPFIQNIIWFCNQCTIIIFKKLNLFFKSFPDGINILE